MANKRNKPEKRKRKQTSTGTPSPSNPAKMADKSNSNTKPKEIVNCTPEQPINACNVLSAAHNTLYGTYPGYPFTPITPYQPPAPNTTPAHFIPQQLQPIPSPSPPPFTPLPVHTHPPAHPQLEAFMSNVTERLKKLDILDDILTRVVFMEGQFKRIDGELSDIKQKICINTNSMENLDQGLGDAHHRIQTLDRQVSELTCENKILKERSVEQQSRSMRENLLFKGIPDTYDPDENTEEKVVEFIKTELAIEDNISFHVVHRLKPKHDRSARSIVAKFEKRKDRNRVLKAAVSKLKNKPQFVVHEQYPIEIIEKRRELVPYLKDAREKGHHAVLKEDKLFIDKRRFYPRGPFVPYVGTEPRPHPGINQSQPTPGETVNQ